jgi:hypothetical protein
VLFSVARRKSRPTIFLELAAGRSFWRDAENHTREACASQDFGFNFEDRVE